MANALREYGKDVRMLVTYAESMERYARDAENELMEERALRMASQEMVKRCLRLFFFSYNDSL